MIIVPRWLWCCLNMIFKRSEVIACVSSVVFFSWFFLAFSRMAEFQNLAGTDPLAMIDVLFPFFWIVLLAFVGVCFVAFVYASDNRLLHALLLSEFSLMLFFTPFLLSGFSWSPDSLWHAGAADYMPEIFSGAKLPLTQYAQAYPISFSITYFARHLLGIGLIDYTLYVYPVVCIVVTAVLAYLFASRLFNPKAAFLAMLLTLPALHYFEPHVSPFSAGTILVFLSFFLLTFKSRWTLSLSFLSILILVFTHPISPIVFGIYVFAALLIGFFFKSETMQNFVIPKAVILPHLIFVVIAWFSWMVFAMDNYLGLAVTISNVFKLGFLNRILFASEFTVGGQAFIYPQIHELGLAIYVLFLFLMVFPFVGDVRGIISGQQNGKSKTFVYKRMVLYIAAVLYAFMGFLLFASSGERFLLGRGLLFFIFMGAMAVASYFAYAATRGRKIKTILIFGIVIFLVCTFPVVSYSKEAYNTFTPSAGAGLDFMSSHVNFSENNISMGAPQQLASYANLSESLNLVDFPPNMTSQSVDVIVLRVNTYFVISMRYDMSFVNNSFTELRDNLSSNPLYNKVYSNSRFEIYSKGS